MSKVPEAWVRIILDMSLEEAITLRDALGNLPTGPDPIWDALNDTLASVAA